MVPGSTPEQVKAIDNLVERWGRGPDQGPIKALCVDCLMVRYDNLWIGIEPDGYTHS